VFTVTDPSHNTGLRVNLPNPDCAVRPTDCADIAVLNTLDGFNLQPRVSVSFSGAIDVNSVSSSNVFFVSLGDTQGGGGGQVVGINQVVWDPATNTLHAESDELLEQHTRYALIVTNRVLDAQGQSIKPPRANRRDHDDSDNALMEQAARRHGQPRIVAASIFTTMSTTSTLEKIHAQVNASHPGPANFNIGFGGERAVFPLASLASVVFNRQNTVAPPLTPGLVPFQALGAIPGAVSALAFGSYSSPDYLASGEFIPQLGTRTGVPVAQRLNTVYFNLVLPAGPRPAGGWPVAIFGHGFGDSRHNSPFVVAASMAAQGIATVAINVVGHGGGPLGTITVNLRTGAPSVSFPAGGRGIDQNGDGRIDSTEGSSAAAPRTLIGSADGLRQTTVDLMQLVRQIQAGIDVDGDGAADLDPSRIYYFGQSFGGMYGTIFLGVERDVRVGVPNVPGGAVVDIIRLSPVFRPLFNGAAAVRGLAGAPAFNENLPLRNLPPVINNIAEAMPLQDLTEQLEWAAQAGNPVAYAPYIRKSPLSGNPAKSVIFQIAKGDQTVPNPTGTAIIRAGELQDRVTYYRNDIAFALSPTVVPKNPHTFLTNIALGGVATAVAFKAQTQIATFFASNGALTIDPDDAPPALPVPVFETPIVLPLPEGLNFIP
jgi:hypothetical protein